VVANYLSPNSQTFPSSFAFKAKDNCWNLGLSFGLKLAAL